jgi:beta-mannosidase
LHSEGSFLPNKKTRISYFQRYPHPVPPKEYPGVQHGEKYRNFLRKSPASFSWDWGPAFIPSGIWRPVALILNQDLYLEDLGVRTRVLGTGKGLWGVEAEVKFHSLVKLQKYPNMSFEIRHVKDGSYLSNTTFSTSFTTDSEEVMTLQLYANVTGVERWFPRHRGKQSLYEMSVQLCTVSQCRSSAKEFGFRTVELDQQQLDSSDEEQRKFEFVINGSPVYIKGANLVPLSVFERPSFNLTNLFDLIERAGMAKCANISVVPEVLLKFKVN